MNEIYKKKLVKQQHTAIRFFKMKHFLQHQIQNVNAIITHTRLLTIKY